MSQLSNKELKILGEISRNSVISQRELSRATGVSLGLINVILKRFLKTGYLHVSSLNKRKLEYILTPQGFLAVARKTYHYATSTIRDYQLLHRSLSVLLYQLRESGFNYFSIYGDGEIRLLIETLAKQEFKESSAILGSDHRDEPGAVVLNVTAEPVAHDFQGQVINVLEKLGNGEEAMDTRQ